MMYYRYKRKLYFNNSNAYFNERNINNYVPIWNPKKEIQNHKKNNQMFK